MKKQYLPIRLMLFAAAAVLFTGCMNPAGPARDSAQSPSMVTIRLAGGEGRTLLPAAPEFAKYSLVFQPHGGQDTVSDINDITPAQMAAGVQVAMQPGAWTVTATGYVEITGVAGIANGFYPAATGSKQITVPVSGPVEIDIDSITDDGEGVLDYAITLPSYATAATMKVLDLTGSPLNPPVEVNLLASAGANTGTQVLPSGYYTLQMRVVGAAAEDETVKTEVLHIYSAMTTYATMTGDFTIIKLTYITGAAAFDLSDKFGAPAPFTAADLTINTPWYTGSIAWTGLSGGNFALGATHEATVTITPKEGFTFGGLLTASSFTYGSITGVTTAPQTDGSAAVTITGFPAVPGLPLVYTVNDASGTEAFTGVYSDGATFVTTTLGANTTFDNNASPAASANDKRVVRLTDTGSQNNGYIALGDTVGKILKTTNDWSIETYVYVPGSPNLGTADSPMIWSFGNSNNITGGGTGVGSATDSPTMWLTAGSFQFKWRPIGWGGQPQIDLGAPAGSTDIRGRWRHIVLTVDSAASKTKLYMDGSLIREGAAINTMTPAQFNYAYLGRSIFHANGDRALRENSEFYRFAVHGEALSEQDIFDSGFAQTLYALNGDNPPLVGLSFLATVGLVEDDPSTEPGAVVGTFSVSGGLPPFAYDFAAGGTDNSKFAIDGNQLKVGSTALTEGAYSVRVSVTDGAGQSQQDDFTFAVIGAAVEPIFDISFENSTYNIRAGKVTTEGSLGYTPNGRGGKSALVFDGDPSNYLRVFADDDSPLLTGVSAFTVTFWLQQTGGNIASWWFFASPYDTRQVWPNEDYIGLHYDQRSASNQLLILERWKGGRNAPGAAAFSAELNNPGSKWYHIAMAHNETSSVLYIDGVQVGTASADFTIESLMGDDSVLKIGNANWRDSNPLGEGAIGNIAEYQIYDVALSAAQIASMTDITVTFDLQGGTLGGNAGPIVVPTKAETIISALLGGIPEKTDGTFFKEWNTEPDGNGIALSHTSPVSFSGTYYAIYDDPIYWDVTFYDYNGDAAAPPLKTIHLLNNETIGSQMPDLGLVGYDVTWWTAPLTGGTQINAATLIVDDIELYSRLTLKPEVVSLTFEADGTNFVGTYRNAAGESIGTINAQLLAEDDGDLPTFETAGSEEQKVVALGGNGGYIDLGREAAMMVNHPRHWTMTIYTNIPADAANADHLISIMQNKGDLTKGVLWNTVQNDTINGCTGWSPLTGNWSYPNNQRNLAKDTWTALSFLHHPSGGNWWDSFIDGNTDRGLMNGFGDNLSTHVNCTPMNYFFLGRDPDGGITSSDIKYARIVLAPTTANGANPWRDLYRAEIEANLASLRN